LFQLHTSSSSQGENLIARTPMRTKEKITYNRPTQLQHSTMAQAMKKEMAKKYTEISIAIGEIRLLVDPLGRVLTLAARKSRFSHDTDTFYALKK